MVIWRLVITGISYYYRQFGYEYALDLGGYRNVFFSAIPSLKADGVELYTLRDAKPEDLPMVMALYDQERSRRYQGQPLLVSTKIDEAYWRFTLEGHSPESGEGWQTHLIQDSDERMRGYVLTRKIRWGNGDSVGVSGLVVEEGLSLHAVLPSVLRALATLGPTLPTRQADAPDAKVITFALGRTHPVYEALGEAVGPKLVPPYVWYVRVPDLPALIRHLAPVLEQRLQRSIVAGHTGNLNLQFYKGGLRISWAEGKLVTAEDWRAPMWDAGDGPHAGFPPLVFLQLLFGHRSLQELRYAFPDVWANEVGTALLEALFPTQPSWVLPLD